MTRAARTSAVILWMLVVAACRDPATLTQLIVVADTNLMVPGQIDRIDLSVTSPDGTTRVRSGPLTGSRAIELPATIGIVHRGGPLGPIEVVARGIRTEGTTDVLAIQRVAITNMVAGRTKTLVLHLESACLGLACDEPSTCAAGVCIDPNVVGSDLPDWTGAPPRASDAGTSCATQDPCNGIDDDCDGAVDEGIDFDTDSMNCGGCGIQCEAHPNAEPACANGQCTLDCNDVWGDCDGNIANGCETPLNQNEICEQCGRSCMPAHAAPTCFLGSCEIALCSPGYRNCNGALEDGCERPVNTQADCGDCGTPCSFANAEASCATGVCLMLGCDPGWANCDGAPGCEARLGTVDHCSDCAPCPPVMNGVGSCPSGVCAIASCNPGFADCDGIVGNGCETRLDTITDCLGCGLGCDLENAVARCGPGGCEVASCEPGWADCDRDRRGCETSLSTPMSCGACGMVCPPATPVCSTDAMGRRVCSTGCQPGEVRCGDSCIDTQTSIEHCGGCNSPCDPPNASGRCAGGQCLIQSCDSGFGNCDPAMPNGTINGCETNLRTLSNCRGCGAICSFPFAAESCDNGTCVRGACDPDRGDCDPAVMGCETDLRTSLAHCGQCNRVCARENAAETCAASMCELGACETGFGNCDNNPLNGCERPLNTLTDCGGCGAACDLPRARDTCATGQCRIDTSGMNGGCDDGFADCDGSPTNGCETSLRSLSDCGGCGMACTVTGGTPTCATGQCRVDVCGPGLLDCDGDPRTCETPNDTLQSCAACGMACEAPPNETTCAGGTCRIARCTVPDTADCDGRVETGCEALLLEDEDHCGACPTACQMGQTCVAGVCT